MSVVGVCLSCRDGENTIMQQDYIRLTGAPVPDTVYIDSVTYTATISFTLQCTTENSCWINPQFIITQMNDTLTRFAAFATYINKGEACDTTQTVRDTTFTKTYTPKVPHTFKSKRFYFEYYSYRYLHRTDTVVVATYNLNPE